MGQEITLEVDRFTLDWAKNYLGSNHSALFLESDVQQVPYYYAENAIEMKEGFARKLSSVKSRLDLLGYSLQSLPGKFHCTVASFVRDHPWANISYEHLQSVVSSVDISMVSRNQVVKGYEFYEFLAHRIFEEPCNRLSFEDFAIFLKACEILPGDDATDDAAFRRWRGHLFLSFFQDFDPYIIIRLLAENKANADCLVQWKYADLVEGGYVELEEIFTPLPDDAKILIVTEGSSDSFVIRRSLQSLRPDIANFFYFVDMQKNYPFTGSGSLFNFCQGLSRIAIQNKVLVVFDNDAAGVENYQRSRALSRPRNLHICKLPDHPNFTAFPTVGPDGDATANINGAAVAIECFLDMRMMPCPRVRWSSYAEKLQRYQGAIEGKESLVEAFTAATLTDGSYDTSRLEFLLDFLLAESISLSLSG